jgi:rubrerythrin
MRSKIAIALAACLLGSFAWPSPASAIAPGTSEAFNAAMHDEATAYADYSAWSDHAADTGKPNLATLLTTTATQERDEHFSELADAAGLVADNASNVQASIAGEAGEAESLYPTFAAQAAARGDRATARMFAELADDEDTHARLLGVAYRALRYGGIWTVPVAPDVNRVRIVETVATVSGQTMANVRQAMIGEAYASAKYRLFARSAYASGNAPLGNLFTGLSDVELREHYAALANRYGLVGSNRSNLWAAISAESGAIMSYARWSSAATTAGDAASSRLLADIMGDEVGHRTAFEALTGTV